MTRTHDPMKVEYHQNGQSSHPTPMIDDEWSNLEKLRWYAGVTMALTGIKIQIVTGVVADRNTGRENISFYGYTTDGSCGGAYTYNQMKVWLNGVEDGYRLVKNGVGR